MICVQNQIVLLALALGCGLVASIGISQVMDKNSSGMPAAVETAPVYVAMFNINLGDPIDASMVALQEWPKDKVPPGVISELSELEGRRPRTAIIQGEPIMEAKLLAPGQTADPIGEIPEGYRLVTIPVDAETSAAGLLSPGDRVDIQLFVGKDSRINVEEAMTKVILQNIRVYAIDQTVQRSADGTDAKSIAKTVSLLLTPAQSSKVHLAEKIGELTLVPRNPNDEDTGRLERHYRRGLTLRWRGRVSQRRAGTGCTANNSRTAFCSGDRWLRSKTSILRGGWRLLRHRKCVRCSSIRKPESRSSKRKQSRDPRYVNSRGTRILVWRKIAATSSILLTKKNSKTSTSIWMIFQTSMKIFRSTLLNSEVVDLTGGLLKGSCQATLLSACQKLGLSPLP